MTDPPVICRKVALAELRVIAEMEKQYFGRHAFGPGMLLYLLVNAGEGFRVAVRDGELVGHVVVRRESVRRGRAELPTFAVREDLRGRGIGTQLLGDVLSYADRVGIRRLDLQVSVGNASARRLYERHGFKPVRTLPGYYGAGEDAFLMRRTAEGV